MQPKIQRITPFLWFDHQAQEAVKFYTAIFKHSKILGLSRYGAAAAAASGRPQGSVMTVSFLLEGQPFVALNGGPYFKFTGAISFVVNCKTQRELDYYWAHLSRGGDRRAQQCGWLKDKYGVSWQIVPAKLSQLLNNPDPGKAERAMQALIQMKKLDIKKLEGA